MTNEQIKAQLVAIRMCLTDMAHDAMDLADAMPFSADEINEPWNEGGAGHEALSLVRALEDALS